MKVLVACEESQEVCKAFRERGHEAYSADIQDCSGGHPEWHIKGDVLPILNGNCYFITEGGVQVSIPNEWDLIIAHPPCTYLTNGGAVQMFRKESKEYPPYGVFQMVNVSRLKLGMRARDFFFSFMNCNCKKVAIENPVPMSIYQLPRETQIIQPFMFGDPYTKKTCLWLKGLPPLFPTELIVGCQPYINGGGGRLERENYKGKKFATWSKENRARSKTFPGIAKAMAEQWG